MNSNEVLLMYVENIKVLLKDHLPEIYKNFEKEDVKHDLFVIDWFMTLFSVNNKIKLEILSNRYCVSDMGYLLFGRGYCIVYSNYGDFEVF
jgi:hypothetical protein